MTLRDFDALARILASAIALWASGGAAALADSPMPPPQDLEVRSPDGLCVARAEVSTSRIVASRVVDGRTETLWTFPGYRRFYEVSDGCRTLVVIYPGANLLTPDDRSPSTVVFTFYENAREVRKITLGELYPDLAVLKRTVSHWLWYQSMGWRGGNWLVETVDGRTLTFDARPRK